MGPSSTALETCRDFATVLAPLVPIREMDSSGGSTVVTSTRDKTDTSTRDKTSTCGIESTDSQLMGYEDTQFLDSQATYGYQQASLPLQPDESSLIPVPDLAKVCDIFKDVNLLKLLSCSTSIILFLCLCAMYIVLPCGYGKVFLTNVYIHFCFSSYSWFRARVSLLEEHMQTPTFRLSSLETSFDSVSLMQTFLHLWIPSRKS